MLLFGVNMKEKIVENVENLPDNDIIDLITKGDIEAIGILIKRYYPTILMFVNQMSPKELYEDAIQEATLSLYSAINNYNCERSSFQTFASLCIKRSVISFLKAQNRKKNIPNELVSSLDDMEIADSNSPEKIFFDRNDYKALTDNIKLELSPLEYNVLQLYISGYRYSVIADKLSVTEKSVSNAMLRIRKKLK